MKKFLLPLLLVALLAIQFYPPQKEVPSALPGQAVSAMYPVPADVMVLLQRACYDCHSNETKYPWYSHVQPVGWWLQKHVDEGRHELNFSIFGTYQRDDHAPIFGAIAEVIREGEMPLESYLWAHPEARLSQQELEKIAAWAEGLAHSVSESGQR